MKIKKAQLEAIVLEELNKYLAEIDDGMRDSTEYPDDDAPYGYDRAGFKRDKAISNKEELRNALYSLHDLSTFMEKHVTHWQDEINVKSVEEFIEMLQKSIKVVSKITNQLQDE